MFKLYKAKLLSFFIALPLVSHSAEASYEALPTEIITRIIHSMDSPEDVRNFKNTTRRNNELVVTEINRIKDKLHDRGLFGLANFELRLAKATKILIPVDIDSPKEKPFADLEDKIRKVDSSAVDGVSNSSFYYFTPAALQKLSRITEVFLPRMPACIGQLTALRALSFRTPGMPRNRDGFGESIPQGYTGHSVPNSIGQLVNLTSLSLIDAAAVNLPNSFSGLTNIQSLNLSQNKFTVIPGQIGSLNLLSYLNLYYNELTTIPEWLGNMRTLRTLILNTNKIEVIPESLGNLTNLEYLDLGRNPIRSDLNALAQLTNLTELRLHHNGLTEVPSCIKSLRLLAQLNLMANKLDSLPLWLAALPALTDIHVAYNKVEQVPEELRRPDLRVNLTDN